MPLVLFLAGLACSSFTTPSDTPVAQEPAAPEAAAPEAAAQKPESECLPQKAQDQALSAVELNTHGYRCLLTGDLEAAHTLLSAAVTRDADYALAHYNLACTLARLRARGEVCEHDASLQAILDHLERAVALDPARATRMRDDPDLDGVRSTVRYQVLAGADLSDDAVLAQVLEQASFWGPAMGVYGNSSRLDLQADHVAVLEKLQFDDQGAPRWAPSPGSWTVSHGQLMLEIDQQSWTFTLHPDGTLTDRHGVAFRNHPDECSA